MRLGYSGIGVVEGGGAKATLPKQYSGVKKLAKIDMYTSRTKTYTPPPPSKIG